MTEEGLVLAERQEKAREGDFLRAVAEAVLNRQSDRPAVGASAIADGEGCRGTDRRWALRAQRRAQQLMQRLPRPHPRRLASGRCNCASQICDRACPRERRGQLFPPISGGPQELGESVDCGPPGSLDRRCVHPPGRRSGAGDGPVGDQQIAGLQAVQEPALAKAGEIDERVHAFLDRPLAGNRLRHLSAQRSARGGV
jgi:hypothetical protein